jgi:hypothetical protein
MSGKGSKPRPLSVDRETYESNWEAIFKKDILKNEYYDILSTEDCFEVEDPDPDKRSWYYDEYGVKRKKPEW